MKHPYQSDKPVSEPVIFGEGVISTEDFDDYFTFTPDGRTIYFTKHSQSFGYGVLVASHFRNGRWSVPEVVEFSGRYNDREPFLSPDGTKLFFASNRPISGDRPKDMDIWVVEKTAGGWGNPVNLGAPVNTPGFDWHPSVTADGTLYFASSGRNGKADNDIYRARFADGKYTDVEALPAAINGPHHDMHPTISADERILLFVSESRPDGLGEDDLYVSYNRNGQWTEAKNLGPKVNSKYYDYSARISPDGKYLFFCRGFGDITLPEKRLSYGELMKIFKSARNGLANIYQIDLSAAGIKP